MNDGLIPNRYAKALFKFASQEGVQASVYDEMKQLEQSYAANTALKTAVNNPFIAVDEKEKVILTAAGAKAGGAFDRFLLLVIKKNRVDFLRLIAQAYIKLYRRQCSIAHVEVVTAAKLPDNEINGILNVVKKHLGSKTLEQSFKVDKDLIGGFTVNVDGQVLDASVKNELSKLRLKLLS